MVFSVLITGCNRGLGLGLAKAFLSSSEPPTHLFAACRAPAHADQLQQLAEDHRDVVHVIQLDVTEKADYQRVVDQVAEVVGDEGLNVLVNNAAISTKNKSLADVTQEDMVSAFNVNCVAPLFLTKAFLHLLERAANKSQAGAASLSIRRAAVIQISSAPGPRFHLQQAAGTHTGNYAYRTSKRALDCVCLSLAMDVKEKGILVVCINPGWVNTDMGGPNATRSAMDVKTCTTHMMHTINQLGDEDHGTFLQWDGQRLRWGFPEVQS